MDSSIFTKSVSHNQDNRQKDERYDNPTFTTFGHTLPGSQKPDGNEQENSMSGNQQQPKIQQQSNSSPSSPTHDNHGRSRVDPGHLTSKPEGEKLHHHKEDKLSEEHGKNSKDHSSEAHTVSSEPVNKESKSTRSANLADQAMYELREVLKELDKGLIKPGQQVIEKNIPKDLFSENISEKIKEDKPIYKWLKDKIEGKENNQNLDVLEETLSPKSGQGNIIEKRENDDGKPLPSTSTGENMYVGNTQLQKGSYRSGWEPEEEERNFQKTKEALEEWKKIKKEC
ncbi:MAG: hypothetical protein ACEY3A_02935 [Wolbachia sp.]